MIDNVVTFEEPAGFRARRTLGNVSATASRPRNLLRSTFRSLGMLVGLAPVESLSEADELRAQALEELGRRASELGANAVVGVQFAVSEDDRACVVTVTGTAVQLEPLQ
ncbi:MAG: heavy metal-binding domain-containing protein [Candidatus Tyrphobacter sp.]